MLLEEQRYALHQLVQTFPAATPDNTVFIGKELPEEAFVSFPARRLRHARLLWINRELLRERGVETGDASLADMEPILLDAFAYAIPADGDDPALFCDEQKEFLGERYGVNSESANGGGVRCGLNGRFQIKGIGKNPLASPKVDHWHTYGGATLDEGVLEALWGELTHQELPHGGIRLLALIATGKEVQSNYGKADGLEEAAASVLMVREPNLRPAHFERAVYFKPAPANAHLMAPDYLRVEKSIQRIELSLPHALDSSVNEGMRELARRIAAQIAAARSMRFVHGANTSSNISIDGRYLDFGTMTALEDYGNRVIARGLPPFWSDQYLIRRMFQDMYFYLRKYRSGIGKDEVDDTLAMFKQVLLEEQSRAFLKVAGIPRSVLAHLDIVAQVPVFQALLKIINSSSLVIPPVRASDGANVLTIVTGCALQRAEAFVYTDIAEAVPSEELATPFVEAFATFLPHLRSAVHQAGLGWDNFVFAAQLQASKFDADLTPLYHWTIVRDTQHMRREYLHRPDGVIDEIGSYLDRLIDVGARADHAFSPDLVPLAQYTLRTLGVQSHIVFDVHARQLLLQVKSLGQVPVDTMVVAGHGALRRQADTAWFGIVPEQLDSGISLTLSGGRPRSYPLQFALAARAKALLAAYLHQSGEQTVADPAAAL